MGSLDNRVAVVTGAAAGLGAGIARHLATQGAIVVCADVADAAPIVDELPVAPDGTRSTAMQLDVGDTNAVEKAMGEVVDRYGQINILVNNAGVAQPIVPVLDSDDQLYERVFTVNVRGVLACSRSAGRIMMKQATAGRIINTASARAKLAWPGLGLYSASKAAVVALTQALALEVAAAGITVNAVCPGTMWTNMSQEAFGVMAAEQQLSRDDLMERHIQGIPVGRLGTPEDMGAAVAFLASDQASFITGVCLNLSGGEDAFF